MKRKLILALLVFVCPLAFTPLSLAYSGAGHMGHHHNQKAGGLGRGKTHVLFTSSYEYEETKNPDVITRTQTYDLHLIYGLFTWLDISVDVPLKYRTVDGKKTYSGPDDIELAAKAVFFKKNGLALAVSPFVTFPNPGYKYGIGEGRIQSGLSLFASQKISPLSLTFIATYKRNENIVNDRLDIYKFYILPWAEITKKLTLTTSFGLERDTNKNNKHYPLYVSGGFMYKVTDYLSLAPSVKAGFQKPERDITVLMGTIWTF